MSSSSVTELELSNEVSLTFGCAAKLATLVVIGRSPNDKNLYWENECNEWMKRISKILKINFESLPPEPTIDAIETLSSTVPKDIHKSVITSFVMASLSNEKNNEDANESNIPQYSALSRACLRSMLNSLKIDLNLLRQSENEVAKTIWLTVKDNNSNNNDTLHDGSEKARLARAQRQKWIKWAATGTGVVIGGVLIGVTGGLAAPALAPLFAALPALGFFATSGGAVALGVMFGLTGGGLSGFRVAKRTAGISEFRFIPLKESDKILANESIFDYEQEQEQTETFKPQYQVRAKSSSSNNSNSSSNTKSPPPVPSKPASLSLKSQNVNIEDNIKSQQTLQNEQNNDKNNNHFNFKSIGKSFNTFGNKTLTGMRKFGNNIASIGKDNNEEDNEVVKSVKKSEKPPSMTATICATGLLLHSSDQCVTIWKDSFKDVLENDERDVFALMSDPNLFLKAGQDINSWVLDTVVKMAGTKILSVTVLGAFMAAVSLPATIFNATGMVIDNAWQGAVDKAKKSGLILSDVINSRIHGKRPLALIGHSLGGLMLVKALLNLPKPDTPIISTLTLIGLPASLSENEWEHLRSFVADEITNAYVPNDIILAMICRLHEVFTIRNPKSSIRVAGLGPVNVEENHLKDESINNEEISAADQKVQKSGQKGHIRDVDLSDILESHFDIFNSNKMKSVLDRIQIE